MKKKLLFSFLLVSSFSFSQTWNITGNAGTDPNTNFLGTSDNQDLIVKTNTAERMRISSTGKVAIGGAVDPNISLRVFGRTQFITDTTTDGVQIHNNLENVGEGSDLLWLTYAKYQSNNVGLLTLTAPSVPPTPWYDPVFSVRANGKVLIGASIYTSCSDCNNYKLFVKDGIKTEKIKVEIATANGWADYVFKRDYALKPLEEVEQFVNNNGHLPNIPSADEVVKNGINLGEMDAKLLEKIEELTLYSIELNKKNKILKDELQEQQDAVTQLLQRVNLLEKNPK